MAGNLGFDTWLVADATATFNKKGLNGEYFPAELIHRTALASLQNEFATVVDTYAIAALFPPNDSGPNDRPAFPHLASGD
jgi:hypothetical protein